MIYDLFDSPLGEVRVVTDGEKILSFGFTGQKHLKEIPEDWERKAEHKVLQKAHQQIMEYFSGKRKTFDLPLSLHGTEFQKKVWNELQKIQFGEVTTYKTIAKRINSSNNSRAVGSAIGLNPVAVIVPCHRVIGTNGSLTGYAGGLERKKSLLTLEGVSIM